MRGFILLLAGGIAVLLAVHQFVWHPAAYAGDSWHLTALPGPPPDPALLDSIASEIARRPVTVTCVAATNRTGFVTWYSNRLATNANLSITICNDLGAYSRLPAGDLTCAEHDPRARCSEALNDVLFAMHVLAHESYHLYGVMNEAETECYALQTLALVLERFGLPRVQAHEILHYWGDHYEAVVQPTGAYASIECHAGGRYDLRPRTPSWPD